MRSADEFRVLRSPWRTAATVLLAAALGVAAVSLVLDGPGPALAAGDCQYAPYGPYDSTCEKARPALTPAPMGGPLLGGFQFMGATVSGGSNPTGTLRFRLFEPDDPSCASAVYESNVTVRGQNGTYFSYEGPSSGSPQATTAGTWRWTVTYSGDAANESTSLGCGSVTVSVAKAEPLLVASIDSGTVAVGTSFPVSVTLQGGYQPSGTLAIRLFGPGDVSCATPVDEKTFGVGGSGPYQAAFTPTAGGAWRVVAAYSGDPANVASTTACGTSTIQALVPPANDDFGDATPVSALPFEDTVDLEGATAEAGEPWGCGFPSRTVWYSFTPDDDMLVTSSLAGAGTLSVFAAGSPGISGLNFVSCGTGTVGLERGVTYYFRVDGSQAGSAALRLESQLPANDEFAGARTITFPRYSDSDDSRYATASSSDPSCFGTGDTVWYAFTPTEDMRLEAALQPWYGDAPSRFTLSAYTGSIGSLTQLDCSDDSLVVSGYRKPHVELDARAGQTVYFMVGTSGGTTGGGYYFSLQRPLDVSVTLDTKGAVSKDGTATVSGAVTCSRTVGSTLWITLDQVFAARQRANGFAAANQWCGPSPASWSASLTSFPILFGPGRATVKLQAPTVCDDQGCQPGALWDETSYNRTTVRELTLTRNK